MKYWIERWSLLRQKELITYPNEFLIHDVYTTLCAKEKLQNGFRDLYEIFTRCYEDILTDPADMLLPTYDMNEYGYFSKEARMSREASYKYAKIFYVLGYSGELKADDELLIPSDRLMEQCKALKITNIGAFLSKLDHYGFIVDGLVNGKMKHNTSIVISCSNRNVIVALHILAVKASNTDRFADFCRLNYKLLENDWRTIEYGNGVDYVSDVLCSEQDRQTAQFIHDELIKRNYSYSFQDWNEGSQIRYYKKENDLKRNANACFWLASMDAELKLFFRIANMDKAIAYIQKCPESVINHFLVSDDGCTNRLLGKCASGISYKLSSKTIWRCGCQHPHFKVTPNMQDYLYYIDAVEMSDHAS